MISPITFKPKVKTVFPNPLIIVSKVELRYKKGDSHASTFMKDETSLF